MPGSFIGELILQAIFEFVFHVIGYYLGRIIVSVLTLGQIKCDRLMAGTPRRKLRWGGAYYWRGQRIYLTADATALIGVVFVVVIAGGGFLIYYLRHEK